MIIGGFANKTGIQDDEFLEANILSRVTDIDDYDDTLPAHKILTHFAQSDDYDEHEDAVNQFIG